MFPYHWNRKYGSHSCHTQNPLRDFFSAKYHFFPESTHLCCPQNLFPAVCSSGSHRLQFQWGRLGQHMWLYMLQELRVEQKNETRINSSKSLEASQQFIYGLADLFWWMALRSCGSLNLTLLRCVKRSDWLVRETWFSCVCVAIDLNSQMPWTGLEARLLWAKEQNLIFLWSKKIGKILL